MGLKNSPGTWLHECENSHPINASVKPPARAAPQGAAAPQRAQTIELTSKKYKAQQLLATLTIVLGMLTTCVATSAGSGGSGAPFGVMFFFGGLVWFIVVRFLIWWDHE
jgi:hypothetical protein